jgi:hypothetical protein
MGKRGLDVKNISDDNIRFATHVMSCKMLQKCRKDEVPATVIAATEKCIEGVQMNWATFLVNQFLKDCIEAQEKGTKFHYAWILILFVLVGWKERGYQCMGTYGRGSMAVRYANLWNTPNKRIQHYNNVTFFVYLENIRYLVEHTLCISTETVEKYKDIV